MFKECSFMRWRFLCCVTSFSCAHKTRSGESKAPTGSAPISRHNAIGFRYLEVLEIVDQKRARRPFLGVDAMHEWIFCSRALARLSVWFNERKKKRNRVHIIIVPLMANSCGRCSNLIVLSYAALVIAQQWSKVPRSSSASSECTHETGRRKRGKLKH